MTKSMTKSDAETISVGVHEAKTHLSRILRLVERGAKVQILRGGAPIARIVPIASGAREIGFAEGAVTVPDDFDDTDPDLVESFYCA